MPSEAHGTKEAKAVARVTSSDLNVTTFPTPSNNEDTSDKLPLRDVRGLVAVSETHPSIASCSSNTADVTYVELALQGKGGQEATSTTSNGLGAISLRTDRARGNQTSD